MELRDTQLLDGGRYVCTPDNWGRVSASYTGVHRLYFPIRGCATVVYGKLRVEIRPGRVFLLPGHRWISYDCRDKLVVDWLHFRFTDPALDMQLGALPREKHWPAREWKFWRSVYQRMGELFRTHPAGLEFDTHAMLVWMLARLQDCAQIGPHNRMPSGRQALLPALEYMENHMTENPSLKEIAAQVHLSPKHFHRCFGQSFGITPHEYLQRSRMSLAWKLLRHEGLSVGAVSQRLHCSNQFYFSRSFKNFFGCSPLDVRLGRSIVRP
jgi:AraC-like DNA-binding protein